MDAARCVPVPGGVTQCAADLRWQCWLEWGAKWRQLLTQIRRRVGLEALDHETYIVQSSAGVCANPTSAAEFVEVQVEAPTACGGVCASCTSPGAIELYCGCIEHPNGSRCACRPEHQLHDADVDTDDCTIATRSPARSSVRDDRHEPSARRLDGEPSFDDANWRERVWTQR